MSIRHGSNIIAGSNNLRSNRSIGEIVFSLMPIEDYGLHLLDGELFDGTGIYESFYLYMNQLYIKNPNLFVTESAWQQSVNDHGVCGKFVLNTTNVTIRLPKITGFVEGTVDSNALGSLVEAGLPNITGKWSPTYGWIDGASYQNSFTAVPATLATGNGSTQTVNYGIDFNASRSSPIYGKSTTVQPQSVKGYYYMVIANSSKISLEVDINKVVSNVNKLNTTTLRTNQITNCITHIPQDIKLELNNGTLTLKAGSKVYIPNGFEDDGVTPKFDEVNITSDISAGDSENTQILVSVISDGTGLSFWGLDTVFSGPTYTGGQYGWWYDTTNNRIRYTTNSGSTWSTNRSLPIAICTSNTIQIASIDQVFNGFGYIGSTVFALPGVKGLIPNGRNADGSLKNIELSLSSVKTTSVTTVASAHKLLLLQDGIYFDDAIYTPNWQFVYKENENIIINTGNNITLKGVLFGKCITDSNNKITLFSPKNAFHAVDYNDTEYIAHQAMPSNRYIDLTLGTSGSQYTAPADGFIYFERGATSGNKYISLFNTSSGMSSAGITISGISNVKIFLPVKKDDVFQASYSADTANPTFRFIYAQGAQ